MAFDFDISRLCLIDRQRLRHKFKPALAIRSGLLQALEWENLESRRIITKVTLMYKILSDLPKPRHEFL